MEQRERRDWGMGWPRPSPWEYQAAEKSPHQKSGTQPPPPGTQNTTRRQVRSQNQDLQVYDLKFCPVSGRRASWGLTPNLCTLTLPTLLTHMALWFSDGHTALLSQKINIHRRDEPGCHSHAICRTWSDSCQPENGGGSRKTLWSWCKTSRGSSGVPMHHRTI